MFPNFNLIPSDDRVIVYAKGYLFLLFPFIQIFNSVQPFTTFYLQKYTNSLHLLINLVENKALINIRIAILETSRNSYYFQSLKIIK